MHRTITRLARIALGVTASVGIGGGGRLGPTDHRPDQPILLKQLCRSDHLHRPRNKRYQQLSVELRPRLH